MAILKKTAPKKLVTSCPFCSGQLAISRLTCQGCDTQIDSTLPIPPFFRLPPDLQEFVMIFLRCNGTIREVEKECGISYPTVIKRLELVNQLLGNTERSTDQSEILGQLERKEISVSAAIQLLKQKQS